MLLSSFACLVTFYCAPSIYFSDYCPITARRWLVKAAATDAEGLTCKPLVAQTLTQKLVMRLAYPRERTLVLKQYADTDARSKGAPSSSPVFIPDIQHPLSLQSLLPNRSLCADLDPHLPPAWPSMVMTCSFFLTLRTIAHPASSCTEAQKAGRYPTKPTTYYRTQFHLKPCSHLRLSLFVCFIVVWQWRREDSCTDPWSVQKILQHHTFNLLVSSTALYRFHHVKR